MNRWCKVGKHKQKQLSLRPKVSIEFYFVSFDSRSGESGAPVACIGALSSIVLHIYRSNCGATHSRRVEKEPRALFCFATQVSTSYVPVCALFCCVRRSSLSSSSSSFNSQQSAVNRTDHRRFVWLMHANSTGDFCSAIPLPLNDRRSTRRSCVFEVESIAFDRCNKGLLFDYWRR